ncbi:hypothetical protein AAAY25_04830 [Brotaphodocola catenula]|uniref:Glycosyltransferase n=1 Tax=Brotaphodocola catenula TaxID=2885361 RepID=A0AAE3ASM2_9FIRM|nr:hypothetical protein [Brotaphodocola catenula]MCC2165204.1 hypothetical protein [Brotaphodocola catenula]
MTKHIPKISIIVPVYNAEQYLEWLYGALNKENAKLAVCKFAQIDETAEPTFELFWESPKIERDCFLLTTARLYHHFKLLQKRAATQQKYLLM